MRGHGRFAAFVADKLPKLTELLLNGFHTPLKIVQLPLLERDRLVEGGKCPILKIDLLLQPLQTGDTGLQRGKLGIGRMQKFAHAFTSCPAALSAASWSASLTMAA